MAVAGLHKASGVDSYLGENHYLASRSCGNNETRTSFIRKMWRELESDNRAGENGRQQMSAVLTGPESPCSSYSEGESMEGEDRLRHSNVIENECPPHQTQNKLEDVPEKEHVRKIFHEWGSKSFGGHSTYTPCMNNCSRAKWVGENECKRVKLVREWIESSTQQGDIRRSGSEEPVTDISSRIERVGDGTVECGAGARSSIRRIYGRQAFLDLLTKFEREREREVEGLLERRFVSNFAHRHRIQSLLKGRFLRNQRFVEDGKQTSVSASELGLLRQTHAVSDIRKGFLSRLNNYEHVPEAAQSDSDTSSDNDTEYEHTEQDEIVGEEFETTNLTSNRESINSQEYASQVAAERHDAHHDYDSDASSDNDTNYEHTEQVEEIVGEEFETTNLTCNWASINSQECASPEAAERHDAHHDYNSDASADNDMMYEHTEQAKQDFHDMPYVSDDEFEITNLTNDWKSQNTLELASPSTVRESHESILKYEQRDRLPLTVEFTEILSQDSVEGNHNLLNVDRFQGTLDISDVEQLEAHEPSACLHTLQTSTNSFNWQQVSTQADEWQEDDDDNDGGGGWYQETVRSDFQESHEEWYDNIVADATDSWMGGNSYLESALVSMNNEYSLSGDDDNGSSRFELRELTTRRTVSNLLQSDFGARLEQLMQSYVDRQDQAFEDENGWMPEQEQPQQQENADGIEDVDSIQGVPIPDFHHEHLTTEGDIINGLRIDMNTLQQRMNDMQNMLEACMNMQLELQRSVHQEIYPALNRSAKSRGRTKDGMWNYQSESSPENGVCFLCCDDDFESLAHRSAYICSQCSQKVNWSKLKESVRHP